jgi:hypothetical protein
MFGVSTFGFNIIKNLFKDGENISKSASLNMERAITSAILTNGGKIKSLLKKFENVDLNNEDSWNYCKFNQDRFSCYEIQKNYFGLDVNPFEIIFVKNIRNSGEHRSQDKSGISDDLYFQIETYKNWMNG